MKEPAAASASVITSSAFTVGMIHFGARPGTRTAVASVNCCRLRSARIKYRLRDCLNYCRCPPRLEGTLLCNRQPAQVVCSRDSLQPAFVNQLFIDSGPASSVNTRHRNTERRRLAIDCSARADHQVTRGDKVRAIQRDRKSTRLNSSHV